MEGKQVFFNDVARRAVAEYELEDYALTFIRHSDNVTFKVDVPGSGAYLLRIHVPATGAMGTHGADPRAVRSELLWLEALSQDTDLSCRDRSETGRERWSLKYLLGTICLTWGSVSPI
jgi:hypothetical protein